MNSPGVDPLNIVIMGAHPDDCEFFAGGISCLWIGQGFRVHFVSLTNGDIGHYHLTGKPLAERRLYEAQKSAALIGASLDILDHHDGELEPTLSLRKEVVGLIRKYQADVVLTHRPNDYHPDHRATSQVVQDAAYMVMVPHFCPEVPRLEHNPFFFYLMDRFNKPIPFQPDIIVPIGTVMERKWDLLDCHESQFYEWLPWLDHRLNEVPSGSVRKEWLKLSVLPIYQSLVPPELNIESIDECHRHDISKGMVEMFEICEYGSIPSDTEWTRLFPFPIHHTWRDKT